MHAWELEAYVRYGDTVFKATFNLTLNGKIEMTSDETVGQYDWSEADKLSTFDRPYRFPPVETRSNRVELSSYRSDFLGRQKKPSDDKNDISTFENEASGWDTNFFQRPLAILSSASCKKLEDNGARVWQTTSKIVALQLEGFDYHTVQVGENDFENRLNWIRSDIARPESSPTAFRYFLLTLVYVLFVLLGSFWFAMHLPQHSNNPHHHMWWRFITILLSLTALSLGGLWLFFLRERGTKKSADFNAQPYTHLARVLRDRGDDHLARKVEAEKMWQEAVQRSYSSFRGSLWKIVWWRPYGVMFGYGLSPLRAFMSVVAIWLLGWGTISMLSRNNMLQANVTKLAPSALVEKGPPTMMIVPAGTSGVPPMNLACNDAIEPGLYSFELLTPILNLHQESRCEIRSKPAGTNSLILWNRERRVPEILTHAVIWEYGKALYMLAGSVITSLALLTFSGIARRWEN